MYAEDDLLPVSALQHLAFCERQCALIHIEGVWEENLFTAQGRVMHDRVHNAPAERRKGVRLEFGVAIRSLRLGLTGKSDVVEFHRQPDRTWRPFPVEYKRGRKKPDNRDNVQLCAQGMCLEEMLDTSVEEGAIYYGKERRRTIVAFSDTLRRETEDTARRLHALIQSGRTPPPVYEDKCRSCSLIDVCMPQTISRSLPIRDYLSMVWRSEEPDEETS